MRILLFGKNGQVGWELQRTLAPLGDLIALDADDVGAHCGDFTDLDDLRRTVRLLEPDVMVNAAAYTSVDKAESAPELANLVNARAPQVLAEEAKRLDAWLVHYSTDYVFDGSGTAPWREENETRPLNVYGRTKLAGEDAIKKAGCRNLVFRTSWVCGVHGNNFAKKMLRLANEQEIIRVVDDQFGAPSTAAFLADMTTHAISCALRDDELSGTYHLVPAGETTWFGFAEFIFKTARALGEELVLQAVEPVPTESYPTPAQRPRNSRLDTRKYQTTFRQPMPPWQEGVASIVAEILGRRK